ncbi:MAG: 4Fe-4S binding protein [Nitrospinae bacterium]|nr:4Fe-4S binding protein [Nitrospinota bacterium]MBF0633220.1 4Fe-4S binding protein [Nitrospinota bacterium]
MEENIIDTPARRTPLSINHEACIYMRSGFSKCRICVDFCPTTCLDLVDGSIVFTESSCVECGICATVCPSSVFSLSRFGEGALLDALDEAYEKDPVVTLTCGKKKLMAPDGSEPSVPAPCLAVLGEIHLVRLVANGAQKVTLTAPCAECEVYNGADVIGWTVDRASSLLGILGWNTSAITFDKTQASQRALQPVTSPVSRRSFLKDVGSKLALKAISSFEASVKTEVANGRLLPSNLSLRRRKLNAALAKAPEETQLTENNSPFRVVTVDSKCTACWACGSYCPTGALERDEMGEGVFIRFTASKCVKCFDCAELCPEKALHYSETFPSYAVKSAPSTLVYRPKTLCESCEKPFMPKGSETRCPACVKWEKFQRQLLSPYFEKEVSSE